MTITKQAEEVFKRWIDCQRIYQHRDLASFLDNIDQVYWNKLVSECDKNQTLHNQIGYLLEADRTTQRIDNANVKLKKLLATIEVDVGDFLDYLKNHHFFDEELPRPLSSDHGRRLSERHVLFMNTLFHHQNVFEQREYLFTIANHFFDYAYVKDSHNIYFDMLHRDSEYPLIIFIQTLLWQFLSAEGWRHWHKNSLSFLKNESEAGKTIVYVAGATDIFQLLVHGIYNIEVIDPFLPSQAADYYAEGWLWLVDGDVGDEINITDNVKLRRHSYAPFDTFQAMTASGEAVNIQHAHITWLVCDRHSAQTIGTVVFKRRMVLQSDFNIDPSKTLLISFNEMYLLGAPSYCDGWGIDANSLPDDMVIAVKQLRKPINAAIFKRLIRAIDTPFRFVNLGACAT